MSAVPLEILGRYTRAVNIARDLGDPRALDGYLLTAAATQALERLLEGLAADSTQRAWRVTGTYGTGKSALGLLLCSLAREPFAKRRGPGALIHRDAPNLANAAKALPHYAVVAISAQHADPSLQLVAALHQVVAERRASAARRTLLERLHAFTVERTAGAASAEAAIALIQPVADFLASGAAATDGLLLVVDEMGRWLEFANERGSQVSPAFFQSLAETCGGRSKGAPIGLVAILHQRFEDYSRTAGGRLGGREWAKVAERFEDISFQEPLDSSWRLVARALRRDGTGIDASRRPLIDRAVALGFVPPSIAGGAADTFPIHPAAMAAALSLFRRFGQNERSMFSFLQSSEPFALQDFVQRAPEGAWYRLPSLCDWLLAQGELRSLDEDRIKRWSLLQELLRTAPVFDGLEVECLKAIGLLNLLEPQAGLPVTRELVAFALADDPADPAVRDAFERLLSKRVVFARAATAELCLWPHSSVDVAAEVARVRLQLPEVERLGDVVELLPQPRPIVAHRHYLERGTLRVVDTQLVDGIHAAVEGAARHGPTEGDGCIWVVPSYPNDDIVELTEKAREASREMPAGHLIALRSVGVDELGLAHELLCWRRVAVECAELRVDAFARREVNSNVTRLMAELILALTDLRLPEHGADRLQWTHRGKSLTFESSRALNAELSNIFDALYGAAPAVRNELINRSVLSSAAAAARQRLLERMFTHEAEVDLGITQTPPEKAIYLSVLRAGGLHAESEGAWAFRVPAAGQGAWGQAGQAMEVLLNRESSITVQAVIDHFARPPFGMRESLTLLMVAAFLRVHRHDLILRERGTYLTRIEGAHLQRLVKRPESFELHMVASQEGVRELLGVYQSVLASHLGRSDLPDSVGALVRALYDWYLSLPEHTLNTGHLKTHYKAALALLGKSGDPVDLLTSGLPRALGVTQERQAYKVDSEVKKRTFAVVMSGLLAAGSGRLDVLRQDIVRALAQALGVGTNTTKVRAHLIGLGRQVGDELVDYALKSLLLRAADPSRTDIQWVDSIASLLGGRAIETWRDDTLLQFRAETRRVVTLLTRLSALAAANASEGTERSVALHIVDRHGRERFVTVPADSGVLPEAQLERLRAALRDFPVPAYALATLLLEGADAPKQEVV